MAIIYFISAKEPEKLQVWLHETFINRDTKQNQCTLEQLHITHINKSYFKLSIPDESFTNEIHKKLRITSYTQRFDFFIKPQIIPAKGIIAFDMDSTFIEEEGVDEISHVLGISAQIAELTKQAMEGKLDFNSSFTRRIGMLKGTHIDVINAVCDQMTASPGITTILPTLKQKGFKTAIISGGLDIFTRRLQEKYQLDYVFSNTVEIRDGKLTDNIAAPIMNADNKQKTLERLAETLQIPQHNIIACGDGANDIPMLTYAGTGIAWKAKPAVRELITNQINFHGFESLLFFIEDGL
ncbi:MULTISPECIES: phosphoserine phosphatase SerB [Citrobacter]|uniref:Phosphoserine phosphatase n=1 Tax=Citrobacter werkmanii TaxID=67827 RepID=A0AA37Z5U8_9ENTR|nr:MULTISPECIES: phosphoserine phosphatase SerB [Citrobacter]MEC3944851.1 phosphoserine phosphatase SerB [Citrobacter werkmanii]TKT98541.1 phosphoserine phosphatase SerB [Citrobacter sp. TBCS-15]HAT7590495.1 phosphoserine phosphatase SerB [Citrobacter werkmanii]HCL5537923.1 phosphoserine phosphatase SerB [Citrobacter werkmanii]HED1353322.1 phosphoserine phosphatase SerB [Citrobacter werkmanii]